MGDGRGDIQEQDCPLSVQSLFSSLGCMLVRFCPFEKEEGALGSFYEEHAEYVPNLVAESSHLLSPI